MLTPVRVQPGHLVSVHMGFGVLSAVVPFWAGTVFGRGGCLCSLHDAERDPGGFGETRAAGGSGNRLVVTTTAPKQNR